MVAAEDAGTREGCRGDGHTRRLLAVLVTAALGAGCLVAPASASARACGPHGAGSTLKPVMECVAGARWTLPRYGGTLLFTVSAGHYSAMQDVTNEWFVAKGPVYAYAVTVAAYGRTVPAAPHHMATSISNAISLDAIGAHTYTVAGTSHIGHRTFEGLPLLLVSQSARCRSGCASRPRGAFFAAEDFFVGHYEVTVLAFAATARLARYVAAVTASGVAHRAG